MGSLKATPNFQSQDQTSNQQQSAQNTTITQLSGNPLNSGTLIGSVSLKSGSNSVSHKLGRKILGYIICGQDKAANVFQESADTTILKLNASADVGITLFVF